MHVLVKQAVCLEGKDYSLGVHELSGKVLANATFKKYLSLGLIVEVTHKPSVPLLSDEERGERVMQKMLEPKAEVKKEDAAPSEVSEKKKLKQK